MPHHILIVDDDPLQCRVVEVILQKQNHRVLAVQSASEAIQYLSQLAGDGVHLVLLDLSMPKMDGLEFLRIIRPLKPHLPIIVLTAHADITKAIEAMKAGANDFILKQDAPERLEVCVNNALKYSALNQEVARLERAIQGQVLFSDILGYAPALKSAIAMAERAAGSTIPVMIEGDSGVGKELFARAIHGSSERAAQPFVAVNCGAIPEHLAESLLFGHEKGAFTGAQYRALGKFREADGGTIFLDEISELRPELQVKLLRVLQEGEVDAVGGKSPVKVDVRIISASNRLLEKAVKEGRFREDLYYRIHVFPLAIPSLKERSDDVPIIAEYMLAKFAARENKRVRTFGDQTLALFRAYHWPGNVRQLENAIFRAVVLSDSEMLLPGDFPEIQRAVQGIGANHGAGGGKMHSNGNGHVHGLSVQDTEGHIRSLAALEKDIILAALEHYNWHISEAARRLKLSRSTLYRKMHDLQISEASSAALKVAVSH